MKFFKNLTKFQIVIFALLIWVSGVLGYLFYDSYRTNIQDRALIKQTKIENVDLNQDLELLKDKYTRLQKETDVLKAKVSKISYKKKTYKKKKLYSAGKSSKHKRYYKKNRINYRKLYFDLKRKCGTKKYKKS